MADTLTSRGIPTVVVPMPVWHWLPCLGGRSMRPMLERIDHTVRLVRVGARVRVKVGVGWVRVQLVCVRAWFGLGFRLANPNPNPN